MGDYVSLRVTVVFLDAQLVPREAGMSTQLKRTAQEPKGPHLKHLPAAGALSISYPVRLYFTVISH